MSRYYHDLGVIVYYKDDILLKDLVIINPEWAVDGAYAVLNCRKVQEKHGAFEEADLEKIWSDPRYRKKQAELLSLMKNYELCFELGQSKKYIVPNFPHFYRYNTLRRFEEKGKPTISCEISTEDVSIQKLISDVFPASQTLQSDFYDIMSPHPFNEPFSDSSRHNSSHSVSSDAPKVFISYSNKDLGKNREPQNW